MPWKATFAVITFVGLLLLPRVTPGLTTFHLYDPRDIRVVWDMPIPPVAGGEIVNGPGMEELKAKRLEALAPENLLDPLHELDHFYAALLKSGAADGRPVRILHYGDSPTTADLVTGDVRLLMQKAFGDAGTGFTLLARPWAWYSHRGVDMDASDWKIDIAGVGDIRDGQFGLGGATFRGGTGATATWKLKDGQHRFVEVSYLAQPDGGSFTFSADNVEVGTAQTAADEVSPGFVSFELPEGSTRFTLTVATGRVRLYGVEFRKARPGVLYSSLGINGASVTMLSRTFNSAHWAAELRHYQPDMVVLAYGTNESGYPKFVDTTWGDELRLAVRRLHNALPRTSILLMSPMDRGERNEQGDIVTIPTLPRLVNTEAKIAKEIGVAFFNTFQAMGGEGTIGRWYAAEPRLVGADYIHPLPGGGKIVGELLFRALSDGFTDFKLRQLKEAAPVEQTPQQAQ